MRFEPAIRTHSTTATQSLWGRAEGSSPGPCCGPEVCRYRLLIDGRRFESCPGHSRPGSSVVEQFGCRFQDRSNFIHGPERDGSRVERPARREVAGSSPARRVTRRSSSVANVRLGAHDRERPAATSRGLGDLEASAWIAPRSCRPLAGTRTVARPAETAAVCAGVSSTKPAPGSTQRWQLSVIGTRGLPAAVSSWIRNVEGGIFDEATWTCQRSAGPVSVALKWPATCDCESRSGAASSIG